MFNPSEILQKVSAVVTASKDEYNASYVYGRTPDKSKVPAYSDIYVEAVNNAEAIRVHAEHGVFPENLFKHRSPNQTDDEFQYIKHNYKQVTLPVFIDYLSTVGRAFADNNWHISYNEDKQPFVTAGKTFQSYVEKELPVYNSLEFFVKSILPGIKAIDAMGVVVVKPQGLPTVETEEGQILIDSTELIEPTVFYYSSKNVVDFEDGKYFLIELDEKSVVDYGGKKQTIGRMFEFYDENVIYLVEQFGKFIDQTFEVRIFFQHDLGVVPVKQLMGIPKIVEKKILHQSPFLFAVDNLDLVVLDSSNLQLSKNNSCYPFRVMVGDPCEFEDKEGNICSDGYIFSQDNTSKMTCPKCNGSGLKARMGPNGVLLLKPSSGVNQGDGALQQKPLEYISPPVDTLVFIDTCIDKNMDKAKKILHLATSNSNIKAGDNVTATGQLVDLKALYAFVKNISDQTFSIYDFLLEAIGKMRYGSEFNKPRLIYPDSFDFKTYSDYIVEISEGIKSGLPPFVIHAILYRFLQTMYNEKETTDVMKLIVETDRCLVMSTDDIDFKLVKNLVAPWEVILHDSAVTLIDELKAGNDKFFEQDFAIQKEQLIELAKNKEEELKPEITNPIDTLV